ncbi:class F sortase [Herbiconiux liukaitaii]|uniref:class F sortase n=1 Tax=Herbiconiux liukaitaii TaxID=3342799 RepID=UPI0035BA6677
MAALAGALLLSACAGPGASGASDGASSARDEAGATSSSPRPFDPAPTSSPSEPPTGAGSPAATEAPLPPARGEPPARLTVPALGLDEELIDLGIGEDGSMEVPTDFSRVGWFTGGGRPGGIGPTVLAGHVDSAVGPAVFFELGALVPGDRFSVTDASGTVFDYEVYRAEDFAKNDFPTAEVFGALLADEVRLITCTGLFDDSTGHYEDNRVVFAARV